MSAIVQAQPSQVFARRLFGSGAVAAALFALYISLVPFQFHRPSGANIAAALSAALSVKMISPANFIANVVLFIPFAFFAAGTLDSRRRPIVSTAAVLAVAALLSVSIEAVQVFVPGRTPSILDVFAQLGGTVVGLVGWRLFEEEARQWLGQVGHGTNAPVLERVLTVYAVCRAVALLLPLDVTVSLSLLAAKYRAGAIRLVPFSGYADFGALTQTFSIDMILAAPIGALAVIGATPQGKRRSLPWSIVLSTLFIACLELAQVVVMSRVADATQVVSGALGAAAGALAMSRFVRLPSRTTPRHQFAGAGLAVLALIASAGAYLVYNWSPFDFAVSADIVRERLPLLFQVPFYGYYQNPEFKAARDSLTKVLAAIPIGIAAACVFSAERITRHSKAYWCLLGLVAGGFFTAVELGQVLLPERYPDITDIIVAMTGFVVGALFTRLSVKHANAVSTQLPQ